MKDFFENNCDIVENLLPIYADGGCSEKTGKLIRKHLDVCPKCRKYLKTVKNTKKCNAKTVAEEIPESLPDYKALSKKIRHRRAMYTSVITSAFLLLVAGDIIYFLTNDK